MKSKIRNDIANELRSLRAKNNITLEELSKQCNISKDAICRYENSTVSINVDNLEKILNYYNIDFCIFFNQIYANKHNKQE